MSIKDDIQKSAEQYGVSAGSSDFFQFEKGENKMRILTHPGHATIGLHFFGKGEKAVVCIGKDEGCPHHKQDDNKPSVKLVTYVIDRKDGNVKLAELPLSVGYALNDLQEDSDYRFSEFPMPYDVKIISDPDNQDPKAKYRVLASPNQEAVTPDEQKAFDDAMANMTPSQYIEKRKEKQKKGESEEKDVRGADYPDPGKDGNPSPEDVPF